MTRLVAALLLLVAACTPPAKPKGGPPSFAEATRGLNAREGLVPTFVGDAEVKVLLPPPGGDGVSLRVIYVASLGAGLGSNPVGLDRGRTSDPVVLAFRVFGDRVLAVAENHAFIADTTDGDEQRAVRESFAESAIWSAKIEARGPRGLLVDLSSLVASDAVGVAERLKEAGQGDFRLDAERSVVDAAATLVFPTNLEAEAIVTFASDNPGSEVDATAPVAGAVTLRMHHSFVKLPDEGYTPRAPDPRMATWSFPYQNYAAPLNESLVREVAIRHRLTTDDEGQVVDPIVFYLDRGTPEPIRSALIEGASWWAEAFEEAGFPGGYRVELLPEGAHPLDARYNIIQWVHRQTRGWSYGNAIWDPRTGEIIKGIVSLGSLRLRHDRRIFEGLLGTAGTGSGAPNDPVELALARVRQLAAHEVGHCLGFPHNMGASQNRRSSVMDYPAPLIRPTSEGALDTSQAYAVGIGDWDKLAVEYLYREVPEGKDPEVFLDGIAARAASEGHTFVTDDHSRPISSAHARGSLWDNGDDPVAMLRETMRVRRIALDRFGPGNLTPGAPQSELRDVLVPVYLYHRYQVDAAAKLLGGYTWRYGVTGKAAPTPVEPVPQERQRAALAALLETLRPEELVLPETLTRLLSPEPAGFYGSRPRERFASATGPIFDRQGAARAAAEVTLRALLDRKRLTRMAAAKESLRKSQTSTTGASGLGVAEVIHALNQTVANGGTGGNALIRLAVAERYVEHVLDLLGPQDLVSAQIAQSLPEIRATLARLEGSEALRAKLDRFIERPWPTPAAEPPSAGIPPGSPIGAFTRDFSDTCWFCEPLP